MITTNSYNVLTYYLQALYNFDRDNNHEIKVS